MENKYYKCPVCSTSFKVKGKNLKEIPESVKCPYCTTDFYTEHTEVTKSEHLSNMFQRNYSLKRLFGGKDQNSRKTTITVNIFRTFVFADIILAIVSICFFVLNSELTHTSANLPYILALSFMVLTLILSLFLLIRAVRVTKCK